MNDCEFLAVKIPNGYLDPRGYLVQDLQQAKHLVSLPLAVHLMRSLSGHPRTAGWSLVRVGVDMEYPYPAQELEKLAEITKDGGVALWLPK